MFARGTFAASCFRLLFLTSVGVRAISATDDDGTLIRTTTIIPLDKRLDSYNVTSLRTGMEATVTKPSETINYELVSDVLEINEHPYTATDSVWQLPDETLTAIPSGLVEWDMSTTETIRLTSATITDIYEHIRVTSTIHATVSITPTTPTGIAAPSVSSLMERVSSSFESSSRGVGETSTPTPTVPTTTSRTPAQSIPSTRIVVASTVVIVTASSNALTSRSMIWGNTSSSTGSPSVPATTTIYTTISSQTLTSSSEDQIPTYGRVSEAATTSVSSTSTGAKLASVTMQIYAAAFAGVLLAVCWLGDCPAYAMWEG